MDEQAREELQEIIYLAQLDLKIDDMVQRRKNLDRAIRQMLDWKSSPPEAFFMNDALRSSMQVNRGQRPAVGNLSQVLTDLHCELVVES